MMFLMYKSFLFLIITEILDEVVNGDKHDLKSLSRTFTIFFIAEIFGIIGGVIHGALIYGLIRLAIFDLIFAKLFKDDWFYLGTTSSWDKFIKKIPLPVVIGVRVACLVLSVYLCLI